MTAWRWVRWRWTELRWGMGNYLSPVATAINTVLLVELYLGDKDLIVPILILSGFTIVATTLGFAHRKFQQSTDAILANQAVIDEIVRRVKEP